MHVQSHVSLMREFATLLGATDAEIQEGSGLEFEHDGLLVRVYPSVDASRILVDVELFRLDEPGRAGDDATTLKLLHQLNGLARVQGDALVSITLDNVVILSNSADVAQASGPQLVELFNQSIDGALGLRTLWTSLDLLVHQRREALADAATKTQGRPAATIYG